MKLRLMLLLVLSLAVLAACDDAPEEEPPSSGRNPADSVLADGVVVRPVRFGTADGLELAAGYYPGGPTAVVIAYMYNEARGAWSTVSHKLAAQGYTVLRFQFRGQGDSQGPGDLKKMDIDLEAATNYVRDEGARNLVLIGATTAAPATAKMAATLQPAALILLSTPAEAQGFSVDDAEMQAVTGAKLFLTSEGDPNKAATLRLFDVAAAPKEQEVYPGETYAATLFHEHREAAVQRMIDFLKANAPPN